mgnify:CR=1 FL=1
MFKELIEASSLTIAQNSQGSQEGQRRSRPTAISYYNTSTLTSLEWLQCTDRRKRSYHDNLGVQPTSVRGARLVNIGL